MNFIKENRWKIALCALITVLPSIVGLIMWNTLVEMARSLLYGGEEFLIFSLLLPLVLLAIFAVGIILTVRDNRHREQSKKVMSSVLFICPVISVTLSLIAGLIILEKTVNIIGITAVLFAALFIIFGNYMPKCKQNFTIGIKTSTTLANEENWNKTHRFTGKVWFICGILALFTAFLPFKIAAPIFLAVILLAAIAPLIYSYAYYKHQLKVGTWVTESDTSLQKSNKKATIINLIFVSVILIFVLILLFTGDITAELGDTSLTIDASYYSELVIDYSEIDSAELRENFDIGARLFGFGSPRLSVGSFQNDEFSSYTLYGYTSAESVVLLKIDEKTVVISLRDAEGTQNLYEELCQKLEGAK